MKKILHVAILVILSLTIACNKVTPKLELTSKNVINVPYEGGDYTITYELVSENGGKIKAITNNDEVVTSIDTKTEGKIRIHVSENTTTQSREATIIVSHDNLCFYVDVKQAENINEPGDNPGDEPGDEPGDDPGDEPGDDPGDDPNDNYFYVNANQLVGFYYGERLINGLGHYWIILSEDGFSNGATVPNSEFFRLDLLGPMSEDEDNARIPDGHYTYDFTQNFYEYLILNIGNTDYLYVDNAGEAWSSYYSFAELDVEGNRIELNAIVGDKEYRVVFDGNYSLTNNIIPENISTFVSDHEINLDNCTGTVSCFNDYWGCGYCNWQIEFVCNDGLKKGTYLVLDFLTDANINGSSGFEGTYRASGFSAEDPTKPAFGPNVFVPGMRISDDGVHMLGSLLVEYVDGIGVDQAPIFGGEFTITANGDGTHTIVMEATDDAEPTNKITLNWTGTLK